MPSSSRAPVIVGDASASAAAPSGASSAFASPKSSTFTVPSLAHLDVRRLQIAMDDALLVRRFERLGDLPRDRQRLVERNRPVRDPIGERRPLDQLHHQRVQAAGVFEAVDLRDVRMIQRREHCASRLNRARRSGSLANAPEQDLDRDVAFSFVSRAR